MLKLLIALLLLCPSLNATTAILQATTCSSINGLTGATAVVMPATCTSGHTGTAIDPDGTTATVGAVLYYSWTQVVPEWPTVTQITSTLVVNYTHGTPQPPTEPNIQANVTILGCPPFQPFGVTDNCPPGSLANWSGQLGQSPWGSYSTTVTIWDNGGSFPPRPAITDIHVQPYLWDTAVILPSDCGQPCDTMTVIDVYLTITYTRRHQGHIVMLAPFEREWWARPEEGLSGG